MPKMLNVRGVFHTMVSGKNHVTTWPSARNWPRLFGGVAHLARASALHAEGSEFDAHHFHYQLGC